MSEDDMDLACLDHSYFHEELKKLTRLIVEVKRDRFERRGAQGTSHEWNVLEQIEIQLDNLCYLNDELVQFDIKDRLNEVYTMAETLFKIKTGKLEDEFIPQLGNNEYEVTDFDPSNNDYQDYHDDYQYAAAGDYYQDYDQEAQDFYANQEALCLKTKGYRSKGKRK